MKKKKLNKNKTALLSIFCFIILFSSQICFSISCKNINGEINCKIPISMELVEGNAEFFLKNQEVICEIENCTISFNINNPTDDILNIEYYAYSYIGSVCTSCIESRDENIQLIKIKPYENKEIQINLLADRTGSMMFKVLYKNPDLKTWRELRGNMIVLEKKEKTLPVAILASKEHEKINENEQISYKAKSKSYSKYGIFLGTFILLIYGTIFLTKKTKLIERILCEFKKIKFQKPRRPNLD